MSQGPVLRRRQRKKPTPREWHQGRVDGAESVVEAAERAFDFLRSRIIKADPADAQQIRDRVTRSLMDLGRWVETFSAGTNERRKSA